MYRTIRVWGWAVLLAAALPFLAGSTAFAQKPGGVLHGMLRENWPSFSIHDEATISAVWPVMPMFSNLVLYDPARPTESAEHLMGELATSWSFTHNGTELNFKLRHGVKWSDGQPFTSKDVKFTFDVVRGASDKHTKLSPRKLWYSNVQDITTQGDYEVTFVLKRPQPGLLSLLASGYSPVSAAHVDPQEWRTKIVGTGPFRLKEFNPDEKIVMVRNPDYFIKDRPYLAGIEYTVIKSREGRIAAMQTGQVDITFPGETQVNVRDQVLQVAPQLKVWAVAQNVSDNILLNTKKPPFNNSKLRQAVNLALNRVEMIKSVLQGGAIESGANLPPPYGEWGLPKEELVNFPGYGDPAKNKAEARRLLADAGYGDPERNRAQARELLAEAGYGPGNPLKVKVESRAIQIYVDTAVWVIDQLKQVGIQGELATFETGVWHPKMARRDFELATNLTGVGADDPDANFYENYSCGSQRNYSDYCNLEVQALIDKQSAETNFKKRLELVREVDAKLQMDGARPILSQRLDYFMAWPFVKGLTPHHSIYNFGRMTDVWLDK